MSIQLIQTYRWLTLISLMAIAMHAGAQETSPPRYVEEPIEPHQGMFQIGVLYGQAVPLGHHGRSDTTDYSSGFATPGRQYQIYFQHSLKNQFFIGVRFISIHQGMDTEAFTSSPHLKHLSISYSIAQVQSLVGYEYPILEKISSFVYVGLGTSFMIVPDRQFNQSAPNSVNGRVSVPAFNMDWGLGIKYRLSEKLAIKLAASFNQNNIKNYPRRVFGTNQVYESNIQNLMLGLGMTASL